MNMSSYLGARRYLRRGVNAALAHSPSVRPSVQRNAVVGRKLVTDVRPRIEIREERVDIQGAERELDHGELNTGWVDEELGNP